MLSYSQPYPSARSPVCAANIVATSQPLATQAGLQALQAGGNAVDAALAAAITLTVVEPNNNGVGSDAFALIWDGAQLHGLNASGRAPRATDPKRFIGQAKMPQFGWDTVTVPGAVSAWVSLSKRFGRLPFERLFERAIGYAREGFQVGPISALGWRQAEQTYVDAPEFAEFARHFLPAPRAGQRVVRAELADSLEEIARSEGASFYHGQLADRIAGATGSTLSREDLAQHQADWVDPIDIDYRDVRLHEIPPNGQGLAAQIALGILRHCEPAAVDTADWFHQQIEAMKIAVQSGR